MPFRDKGAGNDLQVIERWCLHLGFPELSKFNLGAYLSLILRIRSNPYSGYLPTVEVHLGWDEKNESYVLSPKREKSKTECEGNK